MNSSRISVIGIICLVLLSLFITLPGCAAKQQEPMPVQPEPQVQAARPVISALKGDRQVPALGKTQLFCQASASGGDNLTYHWSATGGSLEGAGSTIFWTAPDKAGDYTITVAVNDNTGASARKDIIINVPQKPNNPPVISALRFTRPSHQPITVKLNMTDEEKRKLPELVIRKYEVADLLCIASDPDNDKLDYVWQATGGKLVGTGANIQWIAAGEPGTYTITAEVSDNNGGSTSFSIVVSVHCCSG
jgi:hypothetical protein